MDKIHIELPGYGLLEKLGEGGMGVVWKARQLSLDRLVAIKILMPEWRQDADAMARFRHEAMAAAKLKHSSIIQVFDAGETADAVYFVMEYVEGYTIGQRIHKHGPLDEETALDITLGVAAALSYAWQSAQMIHCDIKPDNIMIDRDGTVKVADLGLARALDPMGDIGADEYIVGTPNYLSPEQARGEANLDCGTDIYALGASLYHMVTGRLPFGDTPGTAPLARQQTDFLLDPLDLNPHVSPTLAALIERMMIKDRRLRPSSWEQFIGDLQEVREGYLPAGDLPPTGASTVLRGAWRTANPGQHRPPPSAPQKMKRSAAATISAPSTNTRATPPPAARAHRRRNWSVVVGQMVMFAALAVAGYAGLYLYSNFGDRLTSLFREPLKKIGEADQRAVPAQAAPPASSGPQAHTVPATTVVLATPQPKLVAPVAAPAPTPPPAAPAPSPQPTAPASSPPANKHSELYRRAARFHNYALDLHRAASNRTTIAVVERVERACRQALQDFNACPEAQSDRAKVEQNIQQCYQILADTRLTAKIAQSAKAPPVKLPPWPSMELAAAPATQVGPGARPASHASAPVDAAALAAAWQTKPKTYSTVLDEFRDLFSIYPPDPEAGLQNVLLYDRVAYGMPATTAARLLGVALGGRQPLTSPLFPAGHYFLHDAGMTTPDGFQRLLLMVDRADSVVAVQLVTDQPTDLELRLPATLFRPHGRCYDFIRGLFKPKPEWRIACRIALVGQLARLDCELASDNPAAPQGLGAPRARSYLYLPQALAAQMLKRAEML